MSSPGRPAGGGGSEVEAALRRRNITQLVHVCGEHVSLVVDHAFSQACHTYARYCLLRNQLAEQEHQYVHLWNEPLSRALQSRYADCRCSPFGRVVRRNTVISGSVAEKLGNPPRPPKTQTTSDVDLMIEVGPVQWTLPGTQETSLAEGNADTRVQHSEPIPRLVIADTENPGFVLVLQERRGDCPHQEQLPFEAEAVTRLFRDHQNLTYGDAKRLNTNGPACSFSHGAISKMFGVCDVDEVPCLHVPVWWFSDEFFVRHRRYSWPPQAVRDNIRRYGLHLVPVGAPGSTTEKVEWRLSFSRAEVVISSHLTDVQRCSAIAFKVCKTALGKDAKVIKSYFVKTALYWLCEETNREDWTSIIQGVLKLLDYLDDAVKSRNLKCYFWSRINLLRFSTRTNRRAMQKTLVTIRRRFMSLLVCEVSAIYPDLGETLTREPRRRSERQLCVCLSRWLIKTGVYNSMMRHTAMTTTDRLNSLLPALVRSYTPDEVVSLLGIWRHWYYLQTTLYRALIVAPEDVASQVHLSASDDGGFVWDAAPLLQLLTEDDLKEVLGHPSAVRAWLKRQHQVPETERPAGLPADRRLPRDLSDLLLNIPLLSQVLRESVPDKSTEYEEKAAIMAQIPTCRVPPLDQARQEKAWRSEQWIVLAVSLHTKLGMDTQTALRMAYQVSVELRQLCDDPETIAEHRRIRYFFPDPWQLRRVVFNDCH